MPFSGETTWKFTAPQRRKRVMIIDEGAPQLYRATNLFGLRVVLWDDAPPDPQSLKGTDDTLTCMDCSLRDCRILSRAIVDHLKQAGARIRCLWVPASGWDLPPSEVNVVVLGMSNPRPAADGLTLRGIPFIIWTCHPEDLPQYPQSIRLAAQSGAEALASALLLRFAIHAAGFDVIAHRTVLQMLPGLRVMARILLQDSVHAEDLVASALEAVVSIAPSLTSKGAVLDALICSMSEQWLQQKLSRPI